MKDSNEILKIYGKERGNTLLQMIKENRITAYRLFLNNLLVSAAYTSIELEKVAVIRES